MKRLMKCSSLSLLAAPLLFGSGCLVNRTDIQDAIAAPITDALYSVISYAMTDLLVQAGLLVA